MGIQTKRTLCANVGKGMRHPLWSEEKVSMEISSRWKLMFLVRRANAPQEQIGMAVPITGKFPLA